MLNEVQEFTLPYKSSQNAGFYERNHKLEGAVLSL